MLALKQLAKAAVQRACSPDLQRALRKRYLVRLMTNNQDTHEEELKALEFLIRPGDSVVDIGANIGQYTKSASRLVGERGHVYAFEPVGDNYGVLETFVRKAKLSNVHCFQLALGARSGSVEMVVPTMEGFRGFYWAHVANDGEGGTRERVQLITLDRIWKEQIGRRVDFVKCDVEGGELGVIHGGLEMARTDRPGWLVEVSKHTSGEVFDAFRGLGYRAFIYEGKLEPASGYANGKSNYFFIHPESRVWDRMSL